MSPHDVDSLSAEPARRGPHAPRSRRAVGRRRGAGFTLVEILIAISILAILAVLAVVATRAAIDSARRSTARATMRMIMVGIEEYTRFWPVPKFPNVPAGRRGAGERRASAGFPEWDCYYLWPFQNYRTLQYRTAPAVMDNQNDLTRFEANECLTYGLLAEVGGGPYLKDPPDDAVFVETTDFNTLHALGGAGQNAPVRRFVDPWGTPYRYSWLLTSTSASPYTEIDDRAGLQATAVRLTSAGPDGFFGDPNGSTQDKQRAKDNVTLTGP